MVNHPNRSRKTASLTGLTLSDLHMLKESLRIALEDGSILGGADQSLDDNGKLTGDAADIVRQCDQLSKKVLGHIHRLSAL